MIDLNIKQRIIFFIKIIYLNILVPLLENLVQPSPEAWDSHLQKLEIWDRLVRQQVSPEAWDRLRRKLGTDFSKSLQKASPETWSRLPGRMVHTAPEARNRLLWKLGSGFSGNLEQPSFRSFKHRSPET